MNINEAILTREERVGLALRALYRQYGYLAYRMSRFEEYEYYMRNKEFLVSDRVIAFNDTDGRLLALKPDVTLSIIKSGADVPGTVQRVCYNENVYRVSTRTHRFAEIVQAGLECIGDIGLYETYEVITLAAASLAQIQPAYVLEVSHLGLLSALVSALFDSTSCRETAITAIAAKNLPALCTLCTEKGVKADAVNLLTALLTSSGERKAVLTLLEQLVMHFPALQPDCAALEKLSGMLDVSPFGEKILFDFSVVNDRNYYNGFAFRGFLNGVSDSVLSGGQYDKMMEKMGRRSHAIGFALYLDALDSLRSEREAYDVDYLLLYEGCDCSAVVRKADELTRAGYTVSVQKEIPDKLRYREIIRPEKEAEKSC